MIYQSKCSKLSLLQMRMKTIRPLFSISSKKFYQIVTEKSERLVPATPEQFILSKHLKGNTNTTRDYDAQAKAYKYWDPKTKKVNYKEIMQKNPHGSIIAQKYKNVNLNMISLNFKDITIKQVYDVCNSFRPDLILIQGKPQIYLPSFQLLPKHLQGFSDKLYLEQLTMDSQAIQDNILSADAIDFFRSQCQQNVLNKSQSQQSRVFITDSKGLIEDEAILTACYYASRQRKQIMMGEMPQQPWRQWICNSHTLMEIQQLFKGICKNVPFYQSLRLPLERLACLLKPDIFVSLRDRYMATLIEMAISTRKYNKILGIFGSMQNQSVMSLLENDGLIETQSASITPVVQYLVGPAIKSSILRNVSGWEVIEKQIIFDILKWGEQIVNVPMDHLEVTNKIVQHYGIVLNSYSKQNILKFRYDKTLEYLQVMREQAKAGEELRKKFLLREAMRASEEQI